MSGFWAQLGQKIGGFFNWALTEHPGKLIGTSLGLGIGLLVVILGFWRTLVIALFVSVGFYLGKRKDENLGLLSWIDNFINKDSKIWRKR